MKPYIPFLVFLLLQFISVGQNQPVYSKVKIQISNADDFSKLESLALVYDGQYAKNRHYTCVLSAQEIEKLEHHHFNYDILIPDVKEHFLEQNEFSKNNAECITNGIVWDQPQHFNPGSMGGYLTYGEMLAELDDMKNQYPNLITSRAPISTTLLTHEGREIYWLRISDNPNTDETDEPEVLYTSLIHAREPGSMLQMIYYMWYLLENYDTDPEIKYLVDHTEMYFIPCVNPDGYIYNETIEPDGGGLWRKNRRDNGDGTFGVDLNRNFGYEWGFDDNGSSPNAYDETYRGPFAFSEPETQNVRDFLDNRNIIIALNYHSHGGLLIRPWGYTGTLPQDIATFDAFAEYMTKENKYTYGDGTQTVGYTANGVTEDYFYGTKGIYSYTPEVGTSFWEAQEIQTIMCEKNMHMNLSIPWLTLNKIKLKDNSNNFISDLSGTMNLDIQKIGLKNESVEIALENTQQFESVGNNFISDLNHLEQENKTMDFTLSSDVQNGDEIYFNFWIDYGAYVDTVTFIKAFGSESENIVFSSNGDNLDGWTNSTLWDTTTEDFFSAPSCITDSPGLPYFSGTENYLTLATPLDLSQATEAYFTFQAKWNIELNYDYAQIQAEINNNGFNPLCGLYTKDGSNFQDLNQPVWDGGQTEWVSERIDLIDYLGESNITCRFGLFSDSYLELDGFYFDDFTLIVITDQGVNTHEYTAENFFIETFPNPVREELNIKLFSTENKIKINIINSLGQLVISKNVEGNSFQMNLENLPQGIYYYQLFSDKNDLLATRKIIVQ